MAAITELKWKSLTGTVNEIKSPNQFLHRLLYGRNPRTLATEDIEFSTLHKGREIAPFVRKNGEGLMVEGHTSTNRTVEAPNIRIKKPFTPSELLFGRQPGTIIYTNAAEQMSAVQEHIARDMQVMADLITNAQEWLAALSIRGTITYLVEDEEVFEITFPKPSTNNVTLTTFWDDATPADVKISNDFHTAKTLISDEVGLQVTDCVMGTEAATSFRNLVAGGHVKTLDLRSVQSGLVTFVEQFREDGAIFLGSFDGIRCWEYGRSASLNGTATSMIRSKYAEFVAATPAAEFVEYFGAIADFKAMQGRRFQAQRFSKSWEREDPSAMMALVHSRPLTVPRRPGATVSMKVVSG